MHIVCKRVEIPHRMLVAFVLTAHDAILTDSTVEFDVDDVTGFLHILYHCLAVCSRQSYPELMRMTYYFWVGGLKFFAYLNEDDKSLSYGEV